MEQIEHILENDVNINNFGGQQSEKDDNSSHSVVTNKTKVAEELEEKREPRNDTVFHEKQKELSSISITSGDSKNCLSAIAEMYSSSDEETCPENSTEPSSNESKMAEDAGSKEMVISNFQSIGVNPIFAQEKGASLQEENNNLNSNNSADTAPQITMMVEPELLKKPESGGGTLVELDNDRQILMKTENDRHTLIESKSEGQSIIEPINDGSKQMESESDRQILLEPKGDGHLFMETKSDRHTVMETESVEHTPTQSTTDECMPINPEGSECIPFGSQNDGHLLTQPGTNRQTLRELGRDTHTPVQQESYGCILAESKNNGNMEGNNDGHIVKVESGRPTVIEPPNDGNENTLSKLKSDGHTPMETDSERNVLIKSESGGCALIEPLNDGCTLKISKSDGHSPMETDNEGNILINSESGGHMLMNTENNKHSLPEPGNDDHTLITEAEGKICSFIEPKSEECSPVELEREEDTPTCSDTSHQVYAMTSIDKELDIIGDSEQVSQMGQHTVHGTEDSSLSDSSSDDESSSSESESSESSSE